VSRYSDRQERYIIFYVRLVVRGGGTVCSGEVLSAKLWTRDTICGVTLNVKLMLKRLRATAAARNIASRIYLCNLLLSPG
jgi:hypothetical protein